MKKMTYFETGSVDPAYNLAFEEYVLTSKREGDFLLLWQNDNTIVIGQNQNADAEINHAFVAEHHIHVIRRATGGGAVYHDLGNLNYSFITDSEGSEKAASEKFTEPIIRALASMGLSAEASGRNDILINGKKVSGTAQRYLNGRVLHHGTLLFDANPDMIAGALQVDREKLKAKGISSVRSRIGNIRQMLPKNMDISEFWQKLKSELLSENAEIGSLAEPELQEIAKLKETKYDTWDWTFGKSLACDKISKKRFSGGTVEAHISLSHGKITAVRFYGDFLSLCDPLDVCKALIGCEFEPDRVAMLLGMFDLSRYFGEITKQELLEVLFT